MAIIPKPKLEDSAQLLLSFDRLRSTRSISPITSRLYGHILNMAQEQLGRHVRKITRKRLVALVDQPEFKWKVMIPGQDPLELSPFVRKVRVGSPGFAEISLGLPLWGDDAIRSRFASCLYEKLDLPNFFTPNGGTIDAVLKLEDNICKVCVQYPERSAQTIFALTSELPALVAYFVGEGAGFSVAGRSSIEDED